jgi:putative chitinase
MLSEDQIKEIYPRAKADRTASFAQQNADLFQRFGIDASPTRLCFFLAQIGHESGGLTITVENMNYSAKRLTQVWPKRFPTLASSQPFAGNPEKLGNSVYANRMGNGSPGSGDGFRYRGRGYIQITGRDGYKQVGAIAGLDLVGDSDLAADPRHALLVACSFWQWKKLNPICDTGDFVKVTRKINGGTNGMTDRRAWLDKVRRILHAPIPQAAEVIPAETIVAVQRALQSRRFTEVGAADGLMGPRTAAAIMRFRQQNGLPDSPPAVLIDDDLIDALGIVL